MVCEGTVVAPCNRLRRFLRPELGPGFLKWFARQASRFGYHGTRTAGIRFRRRNKVPSRVPINAAGAHTEAAASSAQERGRQQHQGGDHHFVLPPYICAT